MSVNKLPQPEQSLGHNLRGTFRALETLVVRALASVNLRYSHFQILYILWQEDGRTQRQIARASFITDTSLAQVLHEMVAEGLVERRRDVDDGRKRLIYLSARGRSMEESASGIIMQVMADVLKGLSDEEISQYVAASIRIRNNIKSISD